MRSIMSLISGFGLFFLPRILYDDADAQLLSGHHLRQPSYAHNILGGVTGAGRAQTVPGEPQPSAWLACIMINLTSSPPYTARTRISQASRIKRKHPCSTNFLRIIIRQIITRGRSINTTRVISTTQLNSERREGFPIYMRVLNL